jgi:hypothetical protein
MTLAAAGNSMRTAFIRGISSSARSAKYPTQCACVRCAPVRRSGRPHIDAHNLSRSNEQRYANDKTIFQLGCFPGAVLLRMNWRCRQHRGTSLCVVRVPDPSAFPVDGMRFPQTSAAHIDQFSLHHPAHLCGSGLKFYLKDFVNLVLDLDDQSCRSDAMIMRSYLLSSCTVFLRLPTFGATSFPGCFD